MGHDKDHPLDCTESHVGCEDSENFDATSDQHGLISKVDKIKLDGLANLSFGTWTNLDSDTGTLVKDAVYQVTSDGFVIANMVDAASVWIDAYTGSNNPPTARHVGNHAGSYAYRAGVTIPVKNADYFKITGYGTAILHWLPIGSGECEIQP